VEASGLPSTVPVASCVGSVVDSRSEPDSSVVAGDTVVVVEKSSSKLNAVVVEGTVVDEVAPTDSDPLSAARVDDVWTVEVVLVTGLSAMKEMGEIGPVV
jgi:hypothetical protein